MTAVRAAARPLALLVVAAVAAACVHTVAARDIIGSINAGPFAYLGKFCFDTGLDANGPWGSLNATIETQLAGLSLYLYNYDEWLALDRDSVSCLDRINITRYLPGRRVSILPGGWEYSTSFVVSQHPQYWYAAVASQDCAQDVSIDSYTLLFLNPGGSQFSVDEYGLVDLYVLFFIMYLGGTLLFYYVHRKAKFWPQPVNTLLISIGTQTVSLFFYMLHWSLYGGDGRGSPFCLALGELLEVMSIIVFTIMTMLLSTGLGVSSLAFDRRGSFVGAFCLLATVVSYAGTFVWYAVQRDPSSSDYAFDSVFGILVAVFTFLTGAWWVWRSRLTYQEERQAVKRAFYWRFALSAGGIYTVMPLVIIMGAAVVEYMQLRVVYSVGQVLRMAINIATAMALFPSTAAPAFAIKASLTLDTVDSMDDHAVSEVYAAL